MIATLLMWDRLREDSTQINEHINDKKIDSARHSVVTEHSLYYNYNFNWKNIKIIRFRSKL